MSEQKLTCPNCGGKNTEGIEYGFVLTTKNNVNPKLTLEVYCYDCKKQTPVDRKRDGNAEEN